ncbi:hypothetical protein J3F83DRAFT_740892 [Trichoderma novae-zelandiae]
MLPLWHFCGGRLTATAWQSGVGILGLQALNETTSVLGLPRRLPQTRRAPRVAPLTGCWPRRGVAAGRNPEPVSGQHHDFASPLVLLCPLQRSNSRKAKSFLCLPLTHQPPELGPTGMLMACRARMRGWFQNRAAS